MNKLGLIILGGIAAIILLANVGTIAVLAVSVALLYFAVKGFMKAETSSAKVGWAILAVVMLSISLSNVPALAGIVAAFVLYFVYKKWNEEKNTKPSNDNDDPFVNFENEMEPTTIKKNL
ncbi:MAG: flagellar basal body rod protein [Bacillaceae bacterium]|nr:flagellar basal body rod protein [Bacillaceae bacterium]